MGAQFKLNSKKTFEERNKYKLTQKQKIKINNEKNVSNYWRFENKSQKQNKTNLFHSNHLITATFFSKHLIIVHKTFTIMT